MAAASAPSRARATANAPPKTLNRYAEIISLRDRYSEETLRALGVTTPEIHLTADPALLIDPGDTPAIRSFLHRSGLADGTRYALFALRPWKDFDRPHRRLCKRGGIRPPGVRPDAGALRHGAVP